MSIPHPLPTLSSHYLVKLVTFDIVTVLLLFHADENS